MRTLKTLTAASAIFLLFGCQTVEVTKSVGRPVPTTHGFVPASQVKRCPQGNCFLTVRVLDCRAGTFEIDRYILTLGGGVGRKLVVVWIIETAGYEFSTNPKAPALEPKGSAAFFGSPKLDEDKVVLVARVKVNDPGQSHEYGLNIVPTGGGAPCPIFDPFMIE